MLLDDMLLDDMLYVKMFSNIVKNGHSCVSTMIICYYRI